MLYIRCRSRNKDVLRASGCRSPSAKPRTCNAAAGWTTIQLGPWHLKNSGTWGGLYNEYAPSLRSSHSCGSVAGSKNTNPFCAQQAAGQGRGGQRQGCCCGRSSSSSGSRGRQRAGHRGRAAAGGGSCCSSDRPQLPAVGSPFAGGRRAISWLSETRGARRRRADRPTALGQVPLVWRNAGRHQMLRARRAAGARAATRRCCRWGCCCCGG